MANKSNGSAETTEPTDTIGYDTAVREGKEIVLEIEAAERGQLRLGELADNLEPKYGDRTLAKFAAEIGVGSKCTLDRYRTVYRAWAGKLAPGPNLVPQYAVLRELATHPEREQIIRQNPNLTKREARDKMRALKRNEKEKAEEARRRTGQSTHGVGSKSLPLSPTTPSGRLGLGSSSPPLSNGPNWQEPSISLWWTT